MKSLNLVNANADLLKIDLHESELKKINVSNI